MAHYDIFGSYKLDRAGNKVTKPELNAFWSARNDDAEDGLCGAVGIYVICFQARNDGPLKPWYVGRTDRQGFESRLRGHELLFRKILDHVDRGNLHIFFLAMRSPNGRSFRRVTRGKILQNDWLESLLIGSCLAQNSRLLNVSKTKALKGIVLPGILNTPARRPSAAESQFRMMIEHH